MVDYTEFTCLDNTFIFESQNSEVFKFRARKSIDADLKNPDDWLPANPEDYIDKFVPPARGNEKTTIGGGRIIQYFGTFQWDADITFTGYLRREEIDDFLAAKELNAIWKLTDYLGNEYLVTFFLEDGFKIENKIKANNIYICKFHFRRAEN